MSRDSQPHQRDPLSASEKMRLNYRAARAELERKSRMPAGEKPNQVKGGPHPEHAPIPQHKNPPRAKRAETLSERKGGRDPKAFEREVLHRRPSQPLKEEVRPGHQRSGEEKLKARAQAQPRPSISSKPQPGQGKENRFDKIWVKVLLALFVPFLSAGLVYALLGIFQTWMGFTMGGSLGDQYLRIFKSIFIWPYLVTQRAAYPGLSMEDFIAIAVYLLTLMLMLRLVFRDKGRHSPSDPS